MNQNNLTLQQLSILNLIKHEPLTSFQILKKTESVKLILSLYNIMDELKNRGVLKSYIKNNIKYHIAC